MSEVDITHGRARVQVEADLWGAYPDEVIRNLRRAVLAVCRAIDTASARELAAEVTTS